MAHRVKQILDAAGAACAGNPSLLAIVEVNRTRSLSEEQAELPALCVNFGADAPDDSGDMRSFSSALELILTAYFAGDSEQEVLDGLLELRTQSHVALMADPSLGLDFVWEIQYAGAEAPALNQSERTLGSQSCRWTVRYLMPFADPR